MRPRIACGAIVADRQRPLVVDRGCSLFTDPKLNAGMLSDEVQIGDGVLPEARQVDSAFRIGSLALIAAVVAFAAAAFAYTAGWFSPDRLTPTKLVAAFKSQGSDPPLGHRRNHAKGICFTGMFEANGAGSELSRAQAFAQGPVPGRLDALISARPIRTRRMRRFGCAVSASASRPRTGRNGACAMINPPVFAVSTPQSFYELLLASTSKDPERDADIRRKPIPSSRSSATGRRTGPGPAATRKSGSTASTALSSPTIRVGSMRCDGRSLPAAQPVAVSPEELAKRGHDFLEQEIAERIRSGPAALDLVGDCRQSRRP